MSIHIALLRGINVGGHNKVAMSDLRDLCSNLGLVGATSLLQSGNLVFQSNRLRGAALEHLLEEETARCLNISADYLVRSAADWRKIIARNPFPEEAENDPGHLVVMCLKASPSAEKVDELQAAIRGPELIRAAGKQLYIVYPAGQGHSKLTVALIEKKLASRGTGRNWNTVVKLAALCQ